ncbi:MAG: hypothetical protein A2622_12665 [Bdellovibrionales bacterium RIFCSPHIGHO2_01_FULL_40_29]|nr:MAG: hypothetical protein A2622_12665 [Bdellovibrionales bacterium RIFCSPHIGHO2_01_FULL_40_29]OFZ33453.1 MAG: hypothetical protein A3D17_14220 [Bdellovibrionales bacterium RIFCSPHIGHO2_02_FULL_40_15]
MKLKLSIVCLALLGFSAPMLAGGLPDCQLIDSKTVAEVSATSGDGSQSIAFLVKREKVSCEHLDKVTESFTLTPSANLDQNLAWKRLNLAAYDQDANQVYTNDMFIGELFGSTLLKPRLPIESKHIVIQVEGFVDIGLSL